MKSYQLINDARLQKQFGRTHMDQCLRILRSDGRLSKYADLSKDEIALTLFVIFSVQSPTESLQAAKNYEKIVHLNKKFKSIWKRFLFEFSAQKELVNDISRIWFGEAASFVMIHFRNAESQTFAVPGYSSTLVSNVRIISAEFLWSIQLQLQQPEYISKGEIVKE
jgi:hypothetical protein